MQESHKCLFMPCKNCNKPICIRCVENTCPTCNLIFYDDLSPPKLERKNHNSPPKPKTPK